MNRKMAMSALLAAATLLSGPLTAQAVQPTFYMRQHMPGMFIKATLRQQVTHPYWGCIPGQLNGFNADYYRFFNEDVVEAGMDLMTHYVNHGRHEGRRACDPRGGTTFEPDDTFTRLLPRNGVREIVATASQDFYELPDGAANVRVSIDGFDVVADRLSLSFIVAQHGMPTLVDLGESRGTELRWPTGTVITLIGIRMEQIATILASYGH